MKNKNYKSLLEKAKKAYDNCVTGAERRRLESIFPELKESEDERVREEIKIVLANTDLSKFALDHTFSDMLVWLETLKRDHWKPTEYDISLLEELARNIRNNVKPFCRDISSFEDLIKKIKTL